MKGRRRKKLGISFFSFFEGFYFISFCLARHDSVGILISPFATLNWSFQILLSNLTTNAMHELKVRAATRSIYNETTIYRGDFSEPQKILLKLNCDQVKASTVVRTATIGLELSAGIIAGGTCVLFALLLALVAIALWR